MKHDDYLEIQVGSNYRKVTNLSGVKTTVCENRFEVTTDPGNDINEQQVVQALREWIHSRKKDV